MVNLENYRSILEELKPFNAQLAAVSKTKPFEDIKILIEEGQRIFGENYVQELVEKNSLIQGAQWHFIGHLQSNKVKQLVSFTSLIQGIDSLKLLKEVNKQASSINKIQGCLLQVHIAKEETKSGFSIEEVEMVLNDPEMLSLKNISLNGFMGMATLTDDEILIRAEFKTLRKLFDKFKNKTFSILSMGMTSDYKIALSEGSNMVRIGSKIFGERG